MKIFAITFGDETGPSARVRLLQYLCDFLAEGDEFVWVPKNKLTLKHLARAAHADVIINQECLLPTRWGWMLKALGKPIIFEWDDALYTRPGRHYRGITRLKILWRLHWWLKNADTVTVPSDFLAAYSKKHGARSVVQIPMALPLPNVEARKVPAKAPVIGWLGSPSNSDYLKVAASGVAEYVAKHPGAKFRVMCGKKPKLNVDFEYVEWKMGADAEFLKTIDVGLLPLADDGFSQGKSPLKAVQYASYGIPIVASSIGGGPAELCAELGAAIVKNGDSWATAIEKVMEKKTYEAASAQGISRVREHHDKVGAFEKLREVLARRK